MIEVSPLVAHVVWILIGLASAGAAALAAYAIVWLKDRRRLVNHEYLRGVLIRLTDAAVTAVKVTQQQTVDDLRRALSDGKLTAEEARTIRDAALERALEYLTANGRREAERIFGGADAVRTLLVGKIEAAVLDLKPPTVALQKPGVSVAPPRVHVPATAGP